MLSRGQKCSWRARSASLVINQILPQGESTPSLSLPPRSNEQSWQMVKSGSLSLCINRNSNTFVPSTKGKAVKVKRVLSFFHPWPKTSDPILSPAPLWGSDKEIQMKVTLPIEKGLVCWNKSRERGEGRATKQESSIKGWRSALTLSYSASNGE